VEGREVTLELLGTNEQEVAYIAGIVDGEGSINARIRSGNDVSTWYPRVEIDMADPQPLQLLNRIFGGGVRRLDKPSNHKTMFRWRLHGARMETFLRAIEPYLLVKKDKANLALSYIACGRGKSARKRELAELISPHRTKSNNVNPDEPNTHHP